MSTFWHKIKGYLAIVTGFVACPCHLPLTLPLLVGLTAGTAFSAWLASNFILVGVLSTVYFIAAVAFGMKWFGEAKPPLPPRPARPRVQLVTSDRCAPCDEAKAVWRGAQERQVFDLEEVHITSPRGRDLAARHNIFTTPAAVVNDRVVLRGVPSLEHALQVFRPVAAAQEPAGRGPDLAGRPGSHL